jgi:hypothetical protein
MTPSLAYLFRDHLTSRIVLAQERHFIQVPLCGTSSDARRSYVLFCFSLAYSIPPRLINTSKDKHVHFLYTYESATKTVTNG